MELKRTQKFRLPGGFAGYLFAIIGQGGTGSYFDQNLGRILKVRKEEGMDFELWLYDKDVVEPKNLIRQNFNGKDIGRNKAQAMALKLANSYQLGAEVKAFAEYLEDENSVLSIFKAAEARNFLPIIIGCVDSMQCRHILHKALRTYDKPAVWIDAGNEEFFGQVIIAACGGITLEEAAKRHDSAPLFLTLPTMVEIAPELFKGNLQKTSEISCAEHAMENVQNISANIWASNLLFTVVNNLLAPNGTIGTIDSHMLRFDARKMTVEADKIEI